MVNSVVTVHPAWNIHDISFAAAIAVGFILADEMAGVAQCSAVVGTTLGLTIPQTAGDPQPPRWRAGRCAATGSTAEPFSWQWLNPLAIDEIQSLLGGFLVALFIFWASMRPWPCRRSPAATRQQAGRTGVIAMMIILVTYVVFTVAVLRPMPGVDESDPLSLTHPDNIDDVFGTMATAAVGPWGLRSPP